MKKLVGKTENKNTKESMATVKIRDLKSADSVRVLGIAQTDREFVDKTTGSQTFGQLKTTKQLVLKCKINDSEPELLLIDENTTLYKQLNKYIESESIELPAKIFDKTFTVGIGGKGTGQYYYFEELYNNVNYDKLFE